MAGLIIEGVCASGKSTVFMGLSQSQAYLERQSKLQFSEHLTERIIENINPSMEDRISLLNGYVDMLENIHANFYNSRFKNTESQKIKPCYLVERFHLTHAVEVLDFQKFGDIDKRLKNIEFKLLVLKMDEAVIKERIEDTFDRRPAIWKNYVLSFGGMDGAVKKYAKMQEKLIEYSEETNLPVKVIDTTDMNWESYIAEALEFWGI